MVKVVVVEYGRESTVNICNCLEIIGVNYIVVRHDMDDLLDHYIPTHVILSGGEDHVHCTIHSKLPDWLIHYKFKVLGICYGMQLISQLFGAKIEHMKELEKGPVAVTELFDSGNFVYDIQKTTSRWMNRYDKVIDIPDNLMVTGISDNGSVAAITDNNRWWGVQYHPEHPEYRDIDVFIRFLRR